MARQVKTTVVKDDDVSRWEDMSIEQLTELLQHNQNIVDSHKDEVLKIEQCSEKITQILNEKKQKAVIAHIESIPEEHRKILLAYTPHSDNCHKDKAWGHWDGFVEDIYHTPHRIACPHCALKYIFENPWHGVNFNMVPAFDYGEGFLNGFWK